MKVNLPKLITSEKSGAQTIGPLSFVLHEIDLKSLNLGLTLTMKYFNGHMTGHLDQVTDNSRPSNASSDDDELDVQQIISEEALQLQLT